MRIIHLLIVACGAFALTTTVLSAQIGIGSSGLRVERAPRSMKDLRDENLVKQRFDFSCGAAALATLLRYGFGEAITEQQILIDLFTPLSDDEKKTVERTGFSMLDLQRVADARGYAAGGFRLDPAQLPKLTEPVIVFIEPRGYKHFAVLRGVQGDRAYLADPSRGNMRQPMYAFLHDWVRDGGTGIIFVVEPKAGHSAGKSPRAFRVIAPSGQPEVITARELLTIGAPLLRPPQPSR